MNVNLRIEAAACIRLVPLASSLACQKALDAHARPSSRRRCASDIRGWRQARGDYGNFRPLEGNGFGSSAGPTEWWTN